ncbi:hypothetical protein CUJ84_Chr002881 [Rhizobium leguminosarum]|uniref:Uncharacterized protein n=1 Tax=Rhizobium leguminosarum TaxID=384 RepID=A0A2K9Z4S2_RHILE|nr:hypothetical protein CUJ84_Chr002881 [Rhizobium leguminosarum]
MPGAALRRGGVASGKRDSPREVLLSPPNVSAAPLIRLQPGEGKGHATRPRLSGLRLT